MMEFQTCGVHLLHLLPFSVMCADLEVLKFSPNWK